MVKLNADPKIVLSHRNNYLRVSPCVVSVQGQKGRKRKLNVPLFVTQHPGKGAIIGIITGGPRMKKACLTFNFFFRLITSASSTNAFGAGAGYSSTHARIWRGTSGRRI